MPMLLCLCHHSQHTQTRGPTHLLHITNSHPENTLKQCDACRLLLTAVVIAIKFVEDHCFVNAHYAKVGGVALAELNRMELIMCSLLDFRFHLPGDPSDILNQERSYKCMDLGRSQAALGLHPLSNQADYHMCHLGLFASRRSFNRL